MAFAASWWEELASLALPMAYTDDLPGPSTTALTVGGGEGKEANAGGSDPAEGPCQAREPERESAPRSLHARSVQEPVQPFELLSLYELAHRDLEAPWHVELETPDLKLHHCMEEFEGKVRNHVRAVGDLDMDIEKLCELFVVPEQRRSWDMLFGQQMYNIESEGDTFVSMEFPGFMGITRRKYLLWYGSQLFGADGGAAGCYRDAVGQAMIFRPADVVREGVPAKDEFRDESIIVGAMLERDAAMPLKRSRLTVVLRSNNFMGTALLTKLLAAPLLRNFGSYYIAEIRREVARRNSSAVVVVAPSDPPVAAVKQVSTEEVESPPSLLVPPSSSFCRRDPSLPVEPFELHQLRQQAAVSPGKDWVQELAGPQFQIYHKTEEHADGGVSNLIRGVVDLDANFRTTCGLIDNPVERRAWDDWFGQDLRIFRHEGGDWLMSFEFTGFTVPGIPRGQYLQWYGAQLYDAAGCEVSSREDAFCQVMLFRPVDEKAKPGLPQRDGWRDDTLSGGVVVERDRTDPGRRSRVFFMLCVVNYFKWALMSKYLAPGLLRHLGPLFLTKLSEAAAGRSQPDEAIPDQELQGLVKPLPRSLYERSPEEPLMGYEFLQLCDVACRELDEKWQLKVDAPGLSLHHTAENLGNGQRVDHLRLRAQLQASFDDVCNLLEDVSSRSSWDSLFGQQPGMEKEAGQWLLSCKFPPLLGLFRCPCPHWCGVQRYDCDGSEVLDRSTAALQAMLLRPGRRGGAGSERRWWRAARWQEGTALGVVVERSTEGIASASSVVLVLRSTNFLGYTGPSQAFSPSILCWLALQHVVAMKQELARRCTLCHADEPSTTPEEQVRTEWVWEVERRLTLFHADWRTPFLPHDGYARWRWVDKDCRKHPWIAGPSSSSAQADRPPLVTPKSWRLERSEWVPSCDSHDCDGEGWQYAWDFSSWHFASHWKGSALAVHCRRRLWRCTYVQEKKDGSLKAALKDRGLQVKNVWPSIAALFWLCCPLQCVPGKLFCSP